MARIIRWVHPSKGGDDYYYDLGRANKKTLQMAINTKPAANREGYWEAPLVHVGRGSKQMEWHPKTYLKKFMR